MKKNNCAPMKQKGEGWLFYNRIVISCLTRSRLRSVYTASGGGCSLGFRWEFQFCIALGAAGIIARRDTGSQLRHWIIRDLLECEGRLQCYRAGWDHVETTFNLLGLCCLQHQLAVLVQFKTNLQPISFIGCIKRKTQSWLQVVAWPEGALYSQ